MYRKAILPFLFPILISNSCFSFINEDNSKVMDKESVQAINHSKALWLNSNNLVWKLDENNLKNSSFFLYYSPSHSIKLLNNKVLKGNLTKKISLTKPTKINSENSLINKFPYILDYYSFDTSNINKEVIKENYLKGELLITREQGGKVIEATKIQKFGVIDDLSIYNKNDLGVSFENNIPVLKLWAPTAKNVKLHLFNTANSKDSIEQYNLNYSKTDNIWFIKGNPSWERKYYIYEIDVYVPSIGKVEKNFVTDPYSVNLSANSKLSQILDINKGNLKPNGWDFLNKPTLDEFSDISIYELHVRDFSINDKSVPKTLRGKFSAFNLNDSNGINHLKDLANSGLTHLHLLPVFDIATIEEDSEKRIEPIIPKAPSDSEIQQNEVTKYKDKDGFNWGYDPFHYNVPEGSYSTNPNNESRIIEFREMIKSLNKKGLRVIMDVVYNHTAYSGQHDKSVLDKIVPNYYYRLDSNGNIQQTTCCPDTASEHFMMEKLIVDSIIFWAKNYKIDGFRFDLMGHHTTNNLIKIRNELNSLTLEKDGVDGKKIYLYGEGWKFGSLDNILTNVAMHQKNSYGLGVGTFNDRIRDSARGGNFSHSTISDQGFINGLYYDYNYEKVNTDTSSDLLKQKETLLNYTDNIRIGLAGNLKDFKFVNSMGNLVKGEDISYRGNKGAGYTNQPYETINYISAHDNYSLWDQITAKVPYMVESRNPKFATTQEKLDMQKLGLSIIALGQGIPFFHAGSDMLRSKSGDGDSYNSGDWFNKLDFTYNENNWGKGLPPSEKNINEWPLWKKRLANKNLIPKKEDILECVKYFQNLLNIRKSSKLFRLGNSKDIIEGIRFLNSEKGISQIPGLIVMNISDNNNIDPNINNVVIVFNANKKEVTFEHKFLKGKNLIIHPIMKEYFTDKEKNYLKNNSGLLIEPRKTLVFIERK